jgi:hypothetical protein
MAPKEKDLTGLSDKELFAENSRIMAARAKAEEGFKAEGAAVKAEIDRRALVVKLGDLSDREKDQLRLMLKREGEEEEE